MCKFINLILILVCCLHQCSLTLTAAAAGLEKPLIDENHSSASTEVINDVPPHHNNFPINPAKPNTVKVVPPPPPNPLPTVVPQKNNNATTPVVVVIHKEKLARNNGGEVEDMPTHHHHIDGTVVKNIINGIIPVANNITKDEKTNTTNVGVIANTTTTTNGIQDVLVKNDEKMIQTEAGAIIVQPNDVNKTDTLVKTLDGKPNDIQINATAIKLPEPVPNVIEIPIKPIANVTNTTTTKKVEKPHIHIPVIIRNNALSMDVVEKKPVLTTTPAPQPKTTHAHRTPHKYTTAGTTHRTETTHRHHTTAAGTTNRHHTTTAAKTNQHHTTTAGTTNRHHTTTTATTPKTKTTHHHHHEGTTRKTPKGSEANISKKPKITYSIEDNKALLQIPHIPIRRPTTKHNKQHNDENAPKTNEHHHQAEYLPDPATELLLDNTGRNSHRRYIIMFIIFIFAMPIIFGLLKVTARRLRNYWYTRHHYRRMDFLVDGMYNC